MNRVRNYTLVIGSISLIIAMAIAYAIAFNVTRPLQTLRQSMQQIEAGNFDISVKVRTRDEVGYLQLTFNKMAKQIRKLITEVYRTELLKKEAEIKALQSQINPHFLYNTLGTIDSLAAIRGDKEISWISQSLGNMFRYNISGGTVATIGEEVGQIRQYLSIQQMRYKDRLTYDIRIAEELEAVRIPKLLLQPIVENAVIHGIEHRREQGTVRIYTEIANERDMRLTVEDNGAGMTEDKLTLVREAMQGSALPGEAGSGRGTFIGLMNVNQRIKLFYGDYYGIEVSKRDGGGTIVSLLLPRDGKERTR